MIKITEDMIDAAETAYLDAIDLGVTNRHIAECILKAVVPLILEESRPRLTVLVRNSANGYE